MIKRDDKKVTPKQFAVSYWLDHLYGTCAWGEDDDDFAALTQKEHEQVQKHLEMLFRRMTRMLKKATGGERE